MLVRREDRWEQNPAAEERTASPTVEARRRSTRAEASVALSPAVAAAACRSHHKDHEGHEEKRLSWPIIGRTGPQRAWWSVAV